MERERERERGGGARDNREIVEGRRKKKKKDIWMCEIDRRVVLIDFSIGSHSITRGGHPMCISENGMWTIVLVLPRVFLPGHDSGRRALLSRTYICYPK